MKIPEHVAIILDGNGRWAKAQGKPRTYGHKVGAKNVEQICKDAYDLGIKYLTFYAFSTENWKRPETEVTALMGLLDSYLKTCIDMANDNNMRVRVIGEMDRLKPAFRKRIAEVTEVTASNTGLNMTIALNYGSRDEMIRAIRKLTGECVAGRVKPEEITEDLFEQYLDTAELPDPDLLIRTSGEQRLSNYLLWQLAYSEFYFTDVPWPAFSKQDLEDAIAAYNKRDRRFGALNDVSEESKSE